MVFSLYKNPTMTLHSFYGLGAHAHGPSSKCLLYSKLFPQTKKKEDF